MAHSFKCVDIGMKCDWSVMAISIRDLMNKVTSHLEKEHGIQALTYDLKKKIDKAAKEDSFFTNYTKK
jgi:predicted small metal-binding protein